MKKRIAILGLFALLIVALMPMAVDATHAWGNYHWARSSNPVVLGLGDNVSAQWDSYLVTSEADWEQSQVLSLSIVPGEAGGRRSCPAAAGKVEICNGTYGSNGWLGVAQISVSGDHITAGSVRLNDSYFNTPTYNTVAWRNVVMCQEIGHIFGLGHNDEDFSTTNGTCMDYSNNPEPNQHPNQHDYQMLEEIYAHTDGGSSGGGGEPPCRGGPKQCPNGVGVHGIDLENVGQWGREVSSDGHHSVFVRDFGTHRVITMVTWADRGHSH